MVALLCFYLTLFVSPLRSKSRLDAENAALRHQLTVLRRKVGGRVQLTNDDRLFLIQLYRWFPSILRAITIIRPKMVRWHRAGFRRYWRWKSRSLGGRPQIEADPRQSDGSAWTIRYGCAACPWRAAQARSCCPQLLSSSDWSLAFYVALLDAVMAAVRGAEPLVDAQCPQSALDRGTVDPVPIADQVARSLIPNAAARRASARPEPRPARSDPARCHLKRCQARAWSVRERSPRVLPGLREDLPELDAIVFGGTCWTLEWRRCRIS